MWNPNLDDDTDSDSFFWDNYENNELFEENKLRSHQSFMEELNKFLVDDLQLHLQHLRSEIDQMKVLKQTISAEVNQLRNMMASEISKIETVTMKVSLVNNCKYRPVIF